NNKLEKAELKPGQRAAIVILLYYHDLKAEARARQVEAGSLYGNGKKLVPDVAQAKTGRTNEIIAKKAGVGKTNVAYLLAVYRNRLDLFYRVRDGEIAIGRAYQQMKDDEKPNTSRQKAKRKLLMK